MNYTEPTPIQTAAIPHVLAGSDVLGIAQTGTGKTAAFVLPTLQRVGTRGGIRMLVVTPTRELAMQIAEVAREASRFTGHRVATVFGGVGLQPQINTLRRGVDIVIALSLIHISEPTRLGMISYAVFCLKKKKKND